MFWTRITELTDPMFLNANQLCSYPIKVNQDMKFKIMTAQMMSRKFWKWVQSYGNLKVRVRGNGGEE